MLQGGQVAKNLQIVEDKEWEKEVWSPPLRIVLAMASSGAMVTTYSSIAQLKREVKRE